MAYDTYEIFTRKSPRMGTPMISFSKIGQIFFNQSAARILQKGPVIEHIFLMWDPTAKKLAMRSTSNKKDPRAYRIHYNAKGNGCSFSAKTFLDYIGIDLGQRVPVPVELDPGNEVFMDVKIPDNLFIKKGQQPLKVVEKTG